MLPKHPWFQHMYFISDRYEIIVNFVHCKISNSQKCAPFMQNDIERRNYSFIDKNTNNKNVHNLTNKKISLKFIKRKKLLPN